MDDLWVEFCRWWVQARLIVCAVALGIVAGGGFLGLVFALYRAMARDIDPEFARRTAARLGRLEADLLKLNQREEQHVGLLREAIEMVAARLDTAQDGLGRLVSEVRRMDTFAQKWEKWWADG